MNSNTNVIVNWKNSRNFNEFLQANSNTENGLDMQEIGMVRVLIYAYENDCHITLQTLVELCNCGQKKVENTLRRLTETGVFIRQRAGNNINDGFQYVLNL